MKKIGENLTIPRNYLRGISFPERTFFTLFPKPKDEDGPFHHKDFPSCVFMELQSHLQRNPKASRVLRQSSIVFGRRELDRDRDQYQILFRRAGRLWPRERREGAVAVAVGRSVGQRRLRLRRFFLPFRSSAKPKRFRTDERTTRRL